MNHRALIRSAAVAAALAIGTVGVAKAAGPIQTSDHFTDRFHDEFILDLCGIDTYTTVTEHWTLKTFPDGSQTFHTTRTFIPEDPRIPVERSAGTSFWAPDGSRRVVGKPIQLFARDGGVTLLDAGWVAFDPAGLPTVLRGPHPSLGVDLADYYCPDR